MSDNFHSPYDDTTRFKPTDMNPPLESLDQGITYLKNILFECDGDIDFNPVSGVISWTDVIRIYFCDSSGQTKQNTVAAGSVTLEAGQFAYVDLNETDGTVLTVMAGSISTSAASNFILFNRLVLAFLNAVSGQLYLNYMRPRFGASTSQLPIRPFTLVFPPEYTGAVLTCSGTNNNPGTLGMTSDVSNNGNNWFSYYEWKSDIAVAVQSYDVFIQIPMPSGFQGFPSSSDVLNVEICTEENGGANNAVDVTLSRDGYAPQSVVTGEVSDTGGFWKTINWASGDGILSSLVAGDVLNVRIRLWSQNGKYARVGKIRLNTLIQ